MGRVGKVSRRSCRAAGLGGEVTEEAVLLHVLDGGDQAQHRGSERGSVGAEASAIADSHVNADERADAPDAPCAPSAQNASADGHNISSRALHTAAFIATLRRAGRAAAAAASC